jgi:hypothetical protein
MDSFLIFKLYMFSINYYNIVKKSSEIIQNVAYDNYDDFQLHIFTKFHFTII